ncbi:TatD family hydrolase [Sporomusa acidovorans]|uniref:D-aminoacyl-tRNA deacylase n=1 Tax=Sporomusa acidovorans (strain ATCC 49682 / DSM 3132 / Mol) TaxID=1123286 RepID=A0ABZ3IW13_SPOA4|nr:TatD family hydrolase [Sporomusa acidovorans]OZC14005.1 putative deoxyribonuclease YcfH [Sporomusa acidovorans DSM 3132]SDF22213.1 TatD DNase family protein [Sporomusa acidovorans]
MLFDSHAHIDDNRFDADRAAVITRAREAGLVGIVNAGACMESSARSIALAAEHAFIYAAVGVHPHDAEGTREEDYEKLASWTTKPKVVAIGEIGLDYYYDLSPREIQQQVFIRQLDVARQCNKPVIIHDRDAHGDLLTIIKKEARGLTGVLHCYSGSWEMAKEILKLGFYISFAGPITYAKDGKLKEVAANVPLERLLVETDCPYLTPKPYRGRRNEPAHVKFTAEEVASVRGMDFAVLAEAATANTKRLFAIS